MKTTTQSSKSKTKPHKVTMSVASRRINAISKYTSIGKIKAQIKKDTNKQSSPIVLPSNLLERSLNKVASFLGLSFPSPKLFCIKMRRLWNIILITATVSWRHSIERNPLNANCSHVDYAPLQDLKKTKNMTWNAIQAIHVERFPDKLVPKSGNVLSSCASSYYHKLWVIIEAEKQNVASAQATQNPEFVFPDDDDDEDYVYNERALDIQAK
ncbi:hypothetical protein BPAE_0122g00090 [Botrytis paeoniae]|uniref:Uncharacterized protein n=1 Tax=Botrytis paeoniae TaxID=278948 RepID=A0A4Z1FGN0_9HELO|nr:hypothetical protein BPAE_0122g00090 [Botrytis paeoniae]